VTVLDVIQRSTEFLAKRGVDSPRLQTELLMAHVLKLPRMQLYLNFDRPLTTTELEMLRDLLKRRSQREPLQHITGSTSFCGLEISVNEHVLIPRPETELLAELGWHFLNQISAERPKEPPIPVAPQTGATITRTLAALDFGTGSGCLAIALAINSPASTVEAVDISEQVIKVAKQNAARHGLADRVGFFQGDGFNALPVRTQFDLIVSNPPYVPTAEIDTLQPEVRDHDPRLALDGGPDGLNFYRRLALEAKAFLNRNAKMMLEFGDGQAEPICSLFEKQNWIVERVVTDYTQRPRILIVRRAD
jgi:release factor glutamine methyltransferase